MIKVFVYITKALIVIATSLLFFSCGMQSVDGTGNVITQQRNAGSGFTKITASGGIEVYIAQGATASVNVEADGNLQEHIKTNVSGNTLEITTDVNIGNAESKKVTVIVPTLTDIEASAGVSLKSTTVIKSENLKVTGSSGSNVEVSLSATKANVEATSGSSVNVSGMSTNLEAKTSSGSTLNAAELKASSVTAEASSGGNLTVNPTEKLKADASSGGSIKYIKTPNSLSKDESSGGSVSQK